MIGRQLEIAALCVVVATLPFYLFGLSVGGQSLSPTELALLLTAALVGGRRVINRPPRAGAHPVSPRLLHSSPRQNPQTDRESADRAVGETLPSTDTESVAAGQGHSPGWSAFDGPILLFLAAALLSLLATEYLRLSLRELRTLIVEPILFWYLCRAVLQSPRDASWLVGTLIGVTTLVAIGGLAQLFLGGAVTDVQGVRRVLGTYTSPNHFALLLGRALPFLVAIAWVMPRWRIWAVAGAALCAGALLATFSVGGWLGSGLAVLVVVGLAGGKRPVIGLASAGIVLAAVVFAAVPVERLAGRLDPRQGTSFVRVQLWQAATELVRESPLLGIGLDNFLYRYPLKMPPETPYEPNLSHPHNLVLQFWLELGLSGLAALGWLLYRFGTLAWPATRSAAGPLLARALAIGTIGSMADFAAHGLVDNGYFLPDMAIVFWLTLAVAATLARPADSH